MSTETASQTPGQVLARRVREARERRNWRQQDLAKRVEELGFRMHPITVSKIEQGGKRAENASVAEVFALAAALDCSPLFLLTPTTDDELVAVTPAHTVSASAARAWIRGAPVLPDTDYRWFSAEMPESELREMQEQARRRLDPLTQALLMSEEKEER
jgi:transcriptional regulator with XRE-family HTH domain